ncbi:MULTISPECIES: calcium-binding protein [unclassified Sphingobium]|uniref:calcium-binding protein n=1 Tax=unclassified Sphingobium TaxID=2611147 RepID=UPI0035A74609
MMTDYVGGPEDNVFNLTEAGGTSSVDGGDGYDVLNLDLRARPFRRTVIDSGQIAHLPDSGDSYEARIIDFQNIEQTNINLLGGSVLIRSIEPTISIADGATIIFDLSQETIGRTIAFDRNGITIGNISYSGFARAEYYGGSGNDVLTGDGSTEIHGGDGDDILNTGSQFPGAYLYGDAGNDILIADGGISRGDLRGGTGDDIYIINSPYLQGYIIENAGEGVDEVRTEQSSYTLDRNVENLTALDSDFHQFDGNELDNRITGNSGNDYLYGLAGNDVIEGGLGNDDRLFGGDGIDSVSYEHAAAAVVVSLAAGTASGGAGNDLLSEFENIRGSAFDDRLTGDDRGNILSGRDGADIMIGLGGDDDYWVDNAGDQVVEAAGGGNSDRVFSAIDYSLPDHVEAIYLIGRANIDAYGNDLDNLLVGNSGNNRLVGQGGEDRMIGGTGDDIYHVNSAGDTVVETPGDGTDLIVASIAIDLTDLLGIENVRLVGGRALSLTGNDLDNVLTGNAGDNLISGRDGNDLLTGKAGRDSFLFDTALAPDNVDRITDFVVGDDLILLARTVFRGTKGALPADAFVVGGAAADTSDRIIYDSTSGALIFDEDGSAGGAAVQFATLTPGLALSAADFLIV